MRIHWIVVLLTGSCFWPFLMVGAVQRESSTTENLLKERVEPPDWKRILTERVAEGLEEPKMIPDWTPPADASAWDQVVFWQRAREGQPSPRAREKMLGLALEQPILLPGVIEFIPETEDAGRQVAARLNGLPQETPEQRKQLAAVRAWVFLQTGLLREEVLEDARNVDWRDFRWGYSSPVFEALLTRDPEAAWAILKDFAIGEDEGLAAVGNRLLWQSGNGEEDWRANLIAAAANPALPDDVRKIASHALLEDESELRPEWMIDAIESAEVFDYPGFCEVVRENPEPWISLLADLAGGDNPLARSRAAELLVGVAMRGRADALRPLLPWVANPDWAQEFSPGRTRSWLVALIARAELREAVGDLQKLLESDEDPSLRAAAAGTLGAFGVKSAVPAMKLLLDEEDLSSRDRDKIIRAILELDGYEQKERLRMIEEFLRESQQAEGELGKEFFVRLSSGSGGDQGRLVTSTFKWNPDEELFRMIQERAILVRETDPVLADSLQQLLENTWVGRSPDILIECLRDGSVSAGQLGSGLRAAAEDDWDGTPFRKLANEPGALGGWAAILSRDERKAAKILEAGDPEAQAAVLAAARISGDPLPLEAVKSLLRSDHPLTQRAAEAYLRSRYDSEALRIYKTFVSQKNSPTIDGPVGEMTSQIHPAFKEPRMEIFRRFGLDENPQEIYALLRAGGWGGFWEWYILVYPDKVVAVRSDGRERLGLAHLRRSQFERLKAFIADYEIDDLPPYHSHVDDGIVYEYIHSTNAKTSRIFMDNPPVDEWSARDLRERNLAIFYSRLVLAFKDLFRELDFEMGYGDGVSILIPRERARVQAVWKEGDDLRVLVENPDKVLLWLGVDPQSGEVLEPAGEPEGFEYLEAEADIPHGFSYSQYHFSHLSRIRAGDAFVRCGRFFEEEGLWLTRRGEEPELLVEGKFLGQVVSSDGEWCAVSKALGTSWATPNEVILVNLKTRETKAVDLPPADTFNVVTYLPEKERFLLFRKEKGGRSDNLDYYTLDPKTGQTVEISGDFRPLNRRGSRPLQEVSDSSLFWAALPGKLESGKVGTVVGQYDREEFRFQPLFEFPGLYFNSDQMWVDEEEGRVFAVIGGDLVNVVSPKRGVRN